MVYWRLKLFNSKISGAIIASDDSRRMGSGEGVDADVPVDEKF